MFVAAIDKFLETIPLGGKITWKQYLLALLVIVAAMAVRKCLSILLNRWLKRLGERIPGEEDDRVLLALHKPFTYIMLVVGIYLGIQVLEPYPRVAAIMNGTFRVAMVVLVLWFLLRVVDLVAFFVLRFSARTETRLDDHVVLLLRSALKVFLYVVAGVNVLEAMGQDVGTVVAGLGLGGLAFALAAKDTVANLFGSITIFMDKPFRVGDRIVVDGTDGVVETLGFRSTRIRTLEKTVVSIPNSEMVIKKIENISRRPHRKVNMTVGVTYETTHQQMEQVVESLRALLETAEGVMRDNYYVYFTEFGGSSLDVLLIYWIVYTDYKEYLTIKEKVNLEIMRRLETLGVEIAFPSRTVYIRRDAETPPTPLESVES